MSCGSALTLNKLDHKMLLLSFAELHGDLLKLPNTQKAAAKMLENSNPNFLCFSGEIFREFDFCTYSPCLHAHRPLTKHALVFTSSL